MQNNGSTHNPLGDIDPFIVTEAAIQARLIELDKEINEAFEERDVAGVAIINLAIIFVTDLIRQLSTSIRLGFIRSARNSNNDKSMQKPEIIDKIRFDFAERYRQLPCIGVLRPELHNPPEWS